VTPLWAIPIIHPAAISRGQYHKEPAQQITLDRVAHYLKSGLDPEPWDINQPPPGALLYPTLPELEEFYLETTTGPWDALSHDLENAGPHIICDGMCQLNTSTGAIGRSLCLRFRRQGGDLYWTDWDSHVAACEFLYRVLSDPETGKVFHNGVTHDVPVLEQLGFTVAGRLMDTMIMMHTAYSEFQKGLQFCATFWNMSPVWKVLVQESDEAEGKG
jgi:hypothetical protein